MAEHLTR